MTYFINPAWIVPLAKKLVSVRGERKKEIAGIGDLFGDPQLLAKYYVEPNCQHYNPADYDEVYPQLQPNWAKLLA